MPNLYSQDLHRGTADYEIIYSYSISLDEERVKESNAPTHIIEDSRIAQKIVSTLEGRLIFDHNSSIYHPPEVLPSENRLAETIASAFVQPERTFYYYRPEDILYIEKLESGTKSQFIDDKTVIWEILQDETIINGLKARKAIGTFQTEGFNDTKVEAWFAPDLPFPFGPVATYGLPGVLLKYKMGSLTITAQSIKRIAERKEEIFIPDFGDVPSLSESVR